MGRAQRRKQERLPAAVSVPARRAVPAPRRAAAADPIVFALLGPLLIATVALLLYANSFAIPFLFDDYFEIQRNPMVKVIESPIDYLRRPRGLPALSFALNYNWRQFDTWGFHLVNVVVHLANGLLVYALALHTLRRPGMRERYGSVAVMLAALVALVFVAHPLQTMAASYIVQRTESIAAFFYLLTVLFFALGSASERPGRRIALYCASGVSAVLGVVSKEVVATVPLAVLAYQLCFPAGARRSLAVRAVFAVLLCVPFAFALMLAWPYLLPANQNVDPDAPRAWLYIPSAGFGLEGVTPWQYLFTQFAVILWYLRLFILPTRQCFDYGWPFVDSFWRVDVVLPLIVLLGLVAAAILAYRRYRLATFCLAWLFITLAPTSSIVPLRDAAFEHRMYLPIVGLSLLVIVGGYDLLGWLAPRVGRSAAQLRRIGAALAGAWLVLLGVATIMRNNVMQSPVALAADSAAKSPANWRARTSLAEALLESGRNDEAVPVLEEAIRLNPSVGSARVQLGQIYIRAGRLDEAEAVLRPATEELEESVAAAALQQLGTVYERRGDSAKAVEMLRRAVERKPQWSSLQAQLAAAYARVGFWFGAAGHYNTALRLNNRLLPQIGNAAAIANVRAAQRQFEDGNYDRAEYLLNEALRYRPNDMTARHYLAVVYSGAGDWDRAQGQLEALKQTLPNDELLHANAQRAQNHEPLVPPPLVQ